MRLLKRIPVIFALLFLLAQTAFAASFVVRQVKVEGNQRLGSSAVLSYVPVHIGQTFNTGDSTAIIRGLYKSGYFSNVSLFRRGSTLVVRVKEWPVISKLTITGNKKIDGKKLQPVLKNLKLQVGDVYNPQKLSEFREGLIDAYKNLGRYDVAVDFKVTQTPYNTVQIHIKVEEGVTTKVHSIRFEGNHAFSSRTLRDQFTLSTPGIFSFFTNFFTHNDRYSPYQYQKDLFNLQKFYLNHGYLRFKILSQKVTVSPNRKHADIFIHLYEGPVYRISGYAISGPYADNPKIKAMVSDIQQGEVFSRKKIVGINKRIADYFSNRGYAFPKINAVPKLNDARQTVFLTFDIKPGKKVYVRFINVGGNGKTTGEAVRYQLRQFEGSAYSLKNIQESKRRIANLPYFKNITITPQPIADSPDQVDLNVNLKERNAGRATIQGGYSDVDGFLYGANISDPNFMGTGRFASIGFQNSQFAQQYSVGYTNPFYTTYGMSRGFQVFYTHTTPNDVNLDSYTMDNYGANVNYAMPISEYNYLTFGYGYNHVAINNINPLLISPGAFQFLQLHGSPYNDFTGSIGFDHSSLDRAIFPTDGNYQAIGTTFGVPVLGTSLSYYKVTYSARWYWRLGRRSGFVLHPHLLMGYGGGYGKINSLPFFLNYFGGGIGTLLGYEPNTLGPKNPNVPSNATGGNVEVFGGVNLIFPNGISDSLRTSVFVDFGNIFQTHRTAGNPGNPAISPTIYESVALKNLRYSAGLMVSWQSPIGLITLGYGIPFNVKPGDQVDQFGFTFGTSL